MEKRTFSLLGGTVLFGYLGCQSPDGGPLTPVTDRDGDSATTRDTVHHVRPDRPEPSTGPLVVRNGPTLGEPCVEPDPGACTKEGMLLMCSGGIRVETAPRHLREWYCVAGDTLVQYGHFGFTGIDRAGPREVPERMVRDMRAAGGQGSSA